ncbi:MAG: VWA domain-containing protein [Acidobacteria bacterium]|nr:MAG: VWA domain-containing protein [Acidobacteriota bacterium]
MKTRRRRLAAALPAILFLALAGGLPEAGTTGTAAQQQPAATFRSQVNVVEVDAVVLDQQARFVVDLRQDEFEILEDGKPQRMASMQLVNIPVERADAPLFATRAIPPDVQTNARPFDGRLYLIVLDDLHTAANRTQLARRIATQFVEQNVAPNDLAAVVSTSGNRKNSQELTGDRALLLAAINRFVGQKVASPGLAGLAQTATPETLSADSAAAQRVFNARSTLETLTDLARFAGGIRNRRKAIVLVGEGIDYGFTTQSKAQQTLDPSNPNADPRGSLTYDTNPREVRDRMLDMVQAANRGNVTLYAFDPRVYTQGGDDLADIASGPPEDMTKDVVVKSAQLQDDLRASQDNLRTMAAETGGFAVTGSPENVRKAFERVRIENSNYYMLGYYASNDARDGKFRKIEVRVKRPGLRVEARKGYTAPKGNAPAPRAVDAKEGTSPELREALGSVLPVSGLTLRATAAPFKGAGDNASVMVLVQLSGRELEFGRKGDRFEDTVELAAVALDGQGKTRGGERLELAMPLSEKMRAFVGQAGLVFQMRLALPPGQYKLRVAGRDGGSGRVGSVLYDLEVPAFKSQPLAMSGLVLSAEVAGQVPNPRPDQALKGLLPASPIAARAFAASDTLSLLAEIYDNDRARPHSVVITTTVRGDDGRELFRQADQRSSAELAGGGGAYGYVGTVPLRELGPGLYVLRVEARSTLNPDLMVSREIQFNVTDAAGRHLSTDQGTS